MGGALRGWPLQKHRAGVENNLAACIYEMAIDCEPRPFAQLEIIKENPMANMPSPATAVARDRHYTAIMTINDPTTERKARRGGRRARADRRRREY